MATKAQTPTSNGGRINTAIIKLRRLNWYQRRLGVAVADLGRILRVCKLWMAHIRSESV